MPLELLGVLNSMNEALALTALTTVLPRTHLVGGQTKLTETLLFKTAIENGELVNISNFTSEKYQGATVLPAEECFHTEPVVVLDFKSLYPSCIQAWNLSVDTFIVNWKEQKSLFTDDEIETIDCGNGNVYHFLKRDVLHGIVPKLLTGLLDERVRVKKLMKKEKAKMRKLILDCRQLSVKIIANSSYGID